MDETSPETAAALRELIVAAVMSLAGLSREDAEREVASGAVSVHMAGDPEEYYRRWNRFYDALSPAEQDAYHHEPCGDAGCAICRLADSVRAREP